MPKFGRRSRKHLETCEDRIQRVLNRVIQVTDCAVIQGHRGETAQDKAYREDRSKLPWPYSEHNTQPSRAVDVVPYPIDWEDRERFHFLAGVIRAMAHEEKVLLVWGGDWKEFVSAAGRGDLPHWQLAQED